jgi:cobaltochelatase CobS
VHRPANTFGTGADRQYVGRNQLDESTLDRFRIGQIERDYDSEIVSAK